MKNFRDLMVWEKAHAFVLQVYKQTKTFPNEELYGLTSQLRRSAASVLTNIAEGFGRRGDKELSRFCDIAMGSASEAEYQIVLAHDLGYIDDHDYRGLDDQILRGETNVEWLYPEAEERSGLLLANSFPSTVITTPQC